MSATALLSAEDVAERLAAAADVLARMGSSGCRPRGYGASWPELRADPGNRDLYGAARGTPARPAPEEISRMDEVLTWPSLIPASRPRERKAVLLRAQGLSWRKIGDAIGASYDTAMKAHLRGVTRIAATLNRRAVA